MSGYQKLIQSCCSYGCIGNHIPAAYKIAPELIYTWGPGYEALNFGRVRIPYDNGPLSNALLMRCEWQGAWGPGMDFGWLIQRATTDLEQDQFTLQGRMDWPSKSAWCTIEYMDPIFAGSCDRTYECVPTDWASGDGLMTPPPTIYVNTWRVDDVPLPWPLP